MLVSESRMLVSESWTLIDEYRMLVNQSQMLVNEARILVNQFRILIDEYRMLVNQSRMLVNKPLAEIPALTLNPSPKLGRGTLKSGSPSPKLGRRGWGMRASSDFCKKFNESLMLVMKYVRFIEASPSLIRE